MSVTHTNLNEDWITDVDIVQIEGFDGYYVDVYGNVYSTRKCGPGVGEGPLRKLAPVEDRKGYLRVTLCANGKVFCKLIHRLVAEAFIPNPDQLPQVNHIDGNRKNNVVWNLEWCTPRENIRHAFDVLHRKPSVTKAVKLTDKETGESIPFESVSECARYLNMSHQYLNDLLRGNQDFNKWSRNDKYSVEYDDLDLE